MRFRGRVREGTLFIPQSSQLWECVLRVVGSAALEVLPWGAWWNADELGRKEALGTDPFSLKNCVQRDKFLKVNPSAF